MRSVRSSFRGFSIKSRPLCTFSRFNLSFSRRPAHSQGSNATGDCCSKCYNEIIARKGKDEESAEDQQQDDQPQAAAPSAPAPADPTPMEVDPAPTNPTPPSAEVGEEEKKPEAAVASPAPEPAKKTKKKKKKKGGYKNMMADMLTGSPEGSRDIDREEIRKVTGGGAFTKIDRI